MSFLRDILGSRKETPSVAYSCVVDRSPKFASQALLWANSLLTLARQDPASLSVNLIEGCHPRYKQAFESLGITTRTVKPFDDRHPHSNKLTQLEIQDLRNADYVVLSDCDVAFCEDISPWISGDALRAKVVDMANFSLDHWERIFEAAQLSLPKSRAVSTFDKLETLPAYCNGGLLIVPQKVYRQLGALWPKWNRWLLERPDLLEPFRFFTDQVSLALSLEESGLAVDHLGLEFNFPTHFAYASPEEITVSPKVIHYHDRVDPSGFLLPTGIATVDQRIENINELIRTTRRTNLDNFSFWEARYS